MRGFIHALSGLLFAVTLLFVVLMLFINTALFSMSEPTYEEHCQLPYSRIGLVIKALPCWLNETRKSNE